MRDPYIYTCNVYIYIYVTYIYIYTQGFTRLDDPPGNLIPAPPSFDPFKPEEHATLGTTVHKDIRKPAWEPKTHHLKTSLVIGIKSFLPSGFGILEPQTNGKNLYCSYAKPALPCSRLVSRTSVYRHIQDFGLIYDQSLRTLHRPDPVTWLHGYMVAWLHV